jgi:hypothetical protein
VPDRSRLLPDRLADSRGEAWAREGQSGIPPRAITDETRTAGASPMLTEREVRLITLYADMIGDHALGVAAQEAVSDHGAEADRCYPAVHTVLRELQQEGYR